VTPTGGIPEAGAQDAGAAGSPVTGAGPPPEAPPWLVVIDMQRIFGEPGSGWLAPRFGEIVAPIGRLAKALERRVIFTRFVAPAVPSGAWRRYYDLWPFALQSPDAPLYQLDPRVAGFAGASAPTLDATTFSKWGPDLASQVAGDGPLVLAGVSTDCCVLSTALAAADAGKQVWVVGDACAGVDDASHAKALDIMRLYSPLVEVVSAADVIGSAAARTR
jgi:nicotinamidase-related amidase